MDLEHDLAGDARVTENLVRGQRLAVRVWTLAVRYREGGAESSQAPLRTISYGRFHTLAVPVVATRPNPRLPKSRAMGMISFLYLCGQ